MGCGATKEAKEEPAPTRASPDSDGKLANTLPAKAAISQQGGEHAPNTRLAAQSVQPQPPSPLPPPQSPAASLQSSRGRSGGDGVVASACVSPALPVLATTCDMLDDLDLDGWLAGDDLADFEHAVQHSAPSAAATKGGGAAAVRGELVLPVTPIEDRLPTPTAASPVRKAGGAAGGGGDQGAKRNGFFGFGAGEGSGTQGSGNTSSRAGGSGSGVAEPNDQLTEVDAFIADCVAEFEESERLSREASRNASVSASPARNRRVGKACKIDDDVGLDEDSQIDDPAAGGVRDGWGEQPWQSSGSGGSHVRAGCRVKAVAEEDMLEDAAEISFDVDDLEANLDALDVEVSQGLRNWAPKPRVISVMKPRVADDDDDENISGCVTSFYGDDQVARFNPDDEF
mmetsp:Transcript_1565/g.3369  ORF Transcript_1565/g.3369 Transcript_1565/m.3369 type:complete len:399 (-) Transcript_1565:816-2012(-)